MYFPSQHHRQFFFANPMSNRCFLKLTKIKLAQDPPQQSHLSVGYAGDSNMQPNICFWCEFPSPDSCQTKHPTAGWDLPISHYYSVMVDPHLSGRSDGCLGGPEKGRVWVGEGEGALDRKGGLDYGEVWVLFHHKADPPSKTISIDPPAWRILVSFGPDCFNALAPENVRRFCWWNAMKIGMLLHYYGVPHKFTVCQWNLSVLSVSHGCLTGYVTPPSHAKNLSPELVSQNINAAKTLPRSFIAQTAFWFCYAIQSVFIDIVSNRYFFY